MWAGLKKKKNRAWAHWDAVFWEGGLYNKRDYQGVFLFCLCLIFKIRLGLVIYSETSNYMHNPPRMWRSEGQTILNFVSVVAGESNSVQTNLCVLPARLDPGGLQKQAGKCQHYGSLSNSVQGHYHYSFWIIVLIKDQNSKISQESRPQDSQLSSDMLCICHKACALSLCPTTSSPS